MTAARLTLPLRSAAWFACAAALGCSNGDDSAAGPIEMADTTVSMDFAAKGDFYASPFPTDARLANDGAVDLSGFPNPSANSLVQQIVTLLSSDTRGFGATSGIFFELSGPVAESDLPDLHRSVTTDSPVVLLAVTPGAPDYLKRYPVSSRFLADAGPYGGANLLAVLPLQGVPLRPETLYAAVVLRSLHDAGGGALGVSKGMADLARGQRPGGMSETAFASYQTAIAALAEAKIAVADVAGLAVFTTGAPTDGMGKVTQAMMAGPLPSPTSPFEPDEVFDDYCVYHTTLPMPEYQEGQPPYSSAGGGWVFDASGAPVLQRQEKANFVVTVPRLPMPAAGYPVVVLSRTGAGGARPLVDRGVQAAHDEPSLEPGTGPALYFAKAGFAGSSIDGPHGGLRNVTHGDEQFLVFNVGNPAALRDNVRQSAAELALQAHILAEVTVDISGCPGASAPGGMARFDPGTMALMGHSMGATIAPLALAFEPRFRAGILSGAGGSMIANVLYKQKPLPVKGLAEVLLGLSATGYHVSEHDPALSLFQWVSEPSDPPVYGRLAVHEPASGPPRHVLMMQGIVDHYIMPPIANAVSLSLGLDLAGEELDTGAPEIATLSPLGPLLDLVGRGKVALPVSLNIENAGGAKATAVVIQHAEDGVEDGHEVVFQTEAPKHEYRCFLESLLAGTPRVPAGGQAMDPCE